MSWPIAIWKERNMSAALLAFLAVLFCILARIFNLASIPEKPIIYYSDSKFFETILKACPSLSDVYCPPALWGRSGHLQTIIHGMFGRVHCPFLKNERCSITLPDGATFTFDTYEPAVPHATFNDYTLAICPGIANSSESLYIKTFVENAQQNGYRCAVLNHIGSLPDVQLSAPRIFSYGGTEEYHQMICYLLATYAKTAVILVGFSMGANIITKYLGEKRKLSKKLVCGISICQGYDAQTAQPLMLQWENLRRFYLWVMTETMKGLLLRYHDVLLTRAVKKKYQLDEKKIFAAPTLVEFDELYTRRISGFRNLSDFYRCNSCAYYMDNITLPMIFLNAADDPVVPPELWIPPKRFVEKHSRSMFILTKHGGHLGYFEGGIVYPAKHTWVDRLIIQMVNAVTMQPSVLAS